MTVSDPAPVPPRPRRPRPTDLSGVADRVGAGTPESARVTGIGLDSRTVEPGDLYAALPGQHAHGADFAAQAAARGAVAALTDPAGAERCRAAGLATVVVEDPRARLGAASALVYGDPARHLAVTGITGTNGKTSVTYLLAAALRRLGEGVAMIGTNGTEYGRTPPYTRIATVRTTPEATELHGILARAVEDGMTSAVTEVSSHAVVMGRVDGIRFDQMGFTNLSQDHLDFHRTMEDYFDAKAEMFTSGRTRSGIVCVDDEWGRRLARREGAPRRTFTTRDDIVADARVRAVRPEGYGLGFDVDLTRGGSLHLRSAVPGLHYVANTLLTALVLLERGVEHGDLAPALAGPVAIPGRMERVVAGDPAASDGITGVVDYSHTEDSLRQALTALRPIARDGRLIVVVGAGGDRDHGKRPRMGAAAAAGADLVVVTDDNPRTEDPAAIRAAVLAGIVPGHRDRVREIGSRAEAIREAVAAARPGDVVLVAGKGAEQGQTIGATVHPFDDRRELTAALTARTGAPSEATQERP